MNIDCINNYLKLKYYNDLIIYTDKNNINNEDIKKYYSTINQSNDDNNLSKTSSESDTIKNINLDGLYNKIWAKLNIIHKIIKLKEFIKSLNIKKNSDREELTNNIIDLLKNKKIKNKEIIYDENNCNIISMPNLQYENNKFYYKIK
jgi:hypothetical protein